MSGTPRARQSAQTRRACSSASRAIDALGAVLHDGCTAGYRPGDATVAKDAGVGVARA